MLACIDEEAEIVVFLGELSKHLNVEKRTSQGSMWLLKRAGHVFTMYRAII